MWHAESDYEQTKFHIKLLIGASYQIFNYLILRTVWHYHVHIGVALHFEVQ